MDPPGRLGDKRKVLFSFYELWYHRETEIQDERHNRGLPEKEMNDQQEATKRV
jgi:hypothetical protein